MRIILTPTPIKDIKPGDLIDADPGWEPPLGGHGVLWLRRIRVVLNNSVHGPPEETIVNRVTIEK